MNNQQPFDREECLRIYLTLLQNPDGRTPATLVSVAVEMAQIFQSEMGTHPTIMNFPAHKPIYSVGRFYASESCLCEETSDGSKILKAEYSQPQQALDLAIALNKAMEVTR